jgi:toxin-antitoxin system, antitoxin component, merR family
LRNLCRAGKVRFVCVGNRWLVNLDSLAAYFNEGDDPAELESRHG